MSCVCCGHLGTIAIETADKEIELIYLYNPTLISTKPLLVFAWSSLISL